MKGHIFNLLEDFIIDVAGDEKLFEIFDRCSFDTSKSFVRTENYPDAQLIEIVTHAVAVLCIDVPTAQFAFGKWLYPRLIKLLPAEFTDFSHPAPVLYKLDELHKVELKKLYPDAIPPAFDYVVKDPTHAELIYCSPRRMFDLVAGVLQGMAEHYGVAIECHITRGWQNDPDKAQFALTYDKPQSVI
ncbi:heme NO-binding domain-containing protein [Pseudoalteromonas fenneropenaei]|uniref:Heme NO-binding domain-containing protein n=1 Tax=Pseudoalteromonas fenneropenaei TaxID=1737459 RepID=A0ABV7CGJ8_9GAMM